MLQYQMLGAGLGAVATTGQWGEGTCKDGNQVVCRTKGGEYICVGCDYPQLDVIKTLQTAINICAGELGLAKIAVDGQIGYRTTTAVGVVGHTVAARTGVGASPIVQLAIASPRNEGTIRSVAMATPTLLSFFASGAAELGKKVPSVKTPVPSVPGVTPPPAYEAVFAQTKKAKYQKAAFGVLATLLTVTLVSTAVYYERYAQRGGY